MKKLRLFKRFQIDFHLSIRKVKRVSYPIPEWADDAWTYIREDKTKHIRYFGKSNVYLIDLPICKDVEVVDITPMYNADRTGYNTNRVIIVDLFF